MPFAIKNYSQEDCDGVWELHQNTIRENDGFVKNLAFHSDVQDIANTYKAFFVMHEKGRVIGMVGLKQMDADTFEVKRLQVASSHQEQGLARKLMEHAIAYARAHKIQRLRLDHSAPLAKAHNLYLSLGFKITHVDKQILGPDKEIFLSTFMQKDLFL